MFRQMRRVNQQLSNERVIDILNTATNGVLGVHGDEGYPYTIPLSFVYFNDKLYFHCGQSGHKLDAIKSDPLVSFCIVDEDTIVSEEFTTYFRSVIAFGSAKIVDDAKLKLMALHALCAKYSGQESIEKRDSEIQASSNVVVVEISIDHLSGKEAKEYAVKNKA